MNKILLLPILLLPACNKDNGSQDSTVVTDPTTQSPHGRIGGIVEDQSGAPLAGVDVLTDQSFTTTAEDGTFTLLDIAPADDIVIKFSKRGYASNYEVVTLIDWETVTSNTTLLEVDGEHTFSSFDETYFIIDSTTLEFEANSFIDEDGNRYNGDVTVEVTHVDPSTDEIEGAPRDLSAIGLDDATQLMSYGMADVTLYGENGEQLSIDPDHPASIRIPITNGDLSADFHLEVGDSQSTWSFDPEQGIWVEESVGTVSENESGLFFNFEATHFSWWNCDQGFVPSCASGQVIDYLGFPVRSAEVTCAGQQTTSTTTTDENGDYTCSIMVGDTVDFTGKTFVGARSWVETNGNLYMDSEGSSAADCEPIPDIQIDVCRVAGAVNIENYDAIIDENDPSSNPADGLSAVFWDPPGDISYCENPWESLLAGECWTGTNGEITSQFPQSAFPGIPANARSAGTWLEVSNAFSSYRMDRSYEGTLPFYTWDSHSMENGHILTDRPDFKQDDVIDVKSNGDYSAYFGPWSVANFATVPSQVYFSADGLTVNGGPLLVSYGNSTGDDVFFSAMVGDEQVVCRFEDDGSFTIPPSTLAGLPAGWGGASVFNLSMTLSPGPDGLPIYAQVFSGEMVPLLVE